MLFNVFPIQTFVNSNRCHITPPHAERPESRFVYGRYVTVDDSGNYVTISRFAKLNVGINIFLKKKYNNNSSQRELGPPVIRRFVV